VSEQKAAPQALQHTSTPPPPLLLLLLLWLLRLLCVKVATAAPASDVVG
jgi:hypothetical protein